MYRRIVLWIKQISAFEKDKSANISSIKIFFVA